jgi:hypothetical protein
MDSGMTVTVTLTRPSGVSRRTGRFSFGIPGGFSGYQKVIPCFRSLVWPHDLGSRSIRPPPPADMIIVDKSLGYP